ncbi:glycosyltransferase family 1 protein [uncultured Aquimarina sp.]|uniref:glycosyltransferase family 4 protein n=1 Tax=uncultured Aquimarina sp. TaxID=575652 RepID=UPI00260E09D1|nr:glycosyltransferase family 1 protein [uncultured Aquimarina sp.]
MIYVNARFLTQKVTGVQRYAIEICKLLPKEILEKRITFIAPKKAKLNPLFKEFNSIAIGKLEGQLWEQIDLPIFLKRKGNPLLINFVGIGPIWYRNKIMTVYDLAFKHHPEWFSKSFQLTYNWFIPMSLKNSKHIITDSNYVKNDLINTYNLPSEKINVVYAAPSSAFVKKQVNKEAMILMVSSLDPRKNMTRVIEAFDQLSIPHKLVIVGARGTVFSDLEIPEPIKKEKIKFTGYIEDEELVELYNKAELFMYPSLFEGFGIPPLEAQKCGTACLISNVTSLPEVYQDSAEYCDPRSVSDIKNKIYDVLTNQKKRNALISKGFLNVKKYNWNKSAEDFILIIKNNMNEKVN